MAKRVDILKGDETAFILPKDDMEAYIKSYENQGISLRDLCEAISRATVYHVLGIEEVAGACFKAGETKESSRITGCLAGCPWKRYRDGDIGIRIDKVTFTEIFGEA